MLPAATFEDVLRRAPAFGDPEDPLGARLISLVFAPPISPIWRDVRTNRALLDLRSGEKWDLFFAGMSAFAKSDTAAIPIVDPAWSEGWRRYFNPRHFDDVERRVRMGHDRALDQVARVPGYARRVGWRYSGGTDLVSFMCYAREPDWLSLVSTRLYDSGGRHITVGEVTEGLRDWRDGPTDVDLAPGEFVGGGRDEGATLPSALVWTANAVGAGVLGNYVFSLIQKLLDH